MEWMENMIEIYIEKMCSLFLFTSSDLCVIVFQL